MNRHMPGLGARRGDEPTIAEDAFVAPGAVLVGAVRLEEGSSVWYGCVLRADGDEIVVGGGSNVQDLTVAHADPGRPVRIGADVTIGHRAIVHGCTIEDGCLIGMGAVLLNNCVIGTGSLVAAGAVVREGMEVPPHSLVAGVPAKVLRELNDDERERVGTNAEVYVELAALYLGDLNA